MNSQERTKEQLLNDLRQSEFEINELKKAEDNYKKIAEALNQERELYADLANALPSGIYRLRVFHDVSLIDENWSSSKSAPYVIEFANDCFFEILNLDRLDFEKNPNIIYKNVFEPDKAEFVRRNVEANLNATPFIWEGRFMINNNIIWIHFESIPRVLENGDIIWTGTLTDITEQKLAEQKLKENENKYRELVDNSPDAIVIYQDNRIVFANNESLQLVGAESIENLLGKSLLEFVHPDSRAFVIERMRKIANKETVLPLAEEKFVRFDGSEIDVEVKATPIGFEQKPAVQLIIRNITERKLSEQTLKESEKKYRFIVENVAEGIGFVNSDEEFVVVNATAERIFGVGKGDLLGKNLKEFLSEDQYLAIINQTKNRAKGQESDYEFEITRPDGAKRTLFIIAVPQFDENNLFIGTHGIFRDITEQKKAELALKESETKLRQLNVDKDRFISIIGHDLRNPFNNLLGLTEVLTEDIHKLNKDEVENIANDINKSARTTYNLLDDILMWARTQQGNIPFKPQNLNFKDICKETLEILTPNANTKNITINCYSEDHINVFADNEMLRTILRNLLTNAIKFTNSGGKITINAELNSGNVTISVSDNGVGIPPENMAKLYDISEVLTTKGTSGETGTGLGLLLCKEFVEKHGGKIWVESEVGKGSIFYFTIPNNNRPDKVNVVKNENIVASDTVDNQLKSLKILIADDDEASRKFLGFTVKAFAKEILYAQNGLEAVAVCNDNPYIDLILMDIKMPEMDGFEATRQIRQFNKDVIIIAQTAFTGSGEKEKALEAGCNDFITKPINKTLLKELIKKHDNK